MGGLWVDYELMTTIKGLYALGKCNFSDHGANRLGANSLLQACVDGYFIAPSTVGNFLAEKIDEPVPDIKSPEFEESAQDVTEGIERILSVNGHKTCDYYHRALGKILWDACGISRQAGQLTSAIDQIRELRKKFFEEVKVTGGGHEPNSELDKALRVQDYLGLGELMCFDALNRNESCGAHFRVEYQTDQGEALRNDNEYSFVSVWQHTNDGAPDLQKESLEFKFVEMIERNYQ